jgi:hypothetical protein
MTEEIKKEELEISYWQDGDYYVHKKGDYCVKYLFKGNLEEINAWISLREKGYEIK